MRSRALAIVLSLLCFPIAAHAEPACGLYQYRAEITRVIDGDTVVADIDLGFHTWRRDEHLRLWGIDTPELHGDTKVAGEKAKEALSARVLNQQLVICTIKDEQEKYGRYLGRSS